MNRTSKLIAGVMAPTVVYLLVYLLLRGFLNNLQAENPVFVLLILAGNLLMVSTGILIAYIFKGITFKGTADRLLVLLSGAPILVFVSFYPAFFIFSVFFIFCPILGYWFAKRFWNW